MNSTPTSNSHRRTFPPRSGGSSRRPTRSNRLQGLFSEGQWLCDCEPQRLPASHFRTKKEGPNQGRWFYTCQKEKGSGCGFFLWDEDARVREEGALLVGNSRSETRDRPRRNAAARESEIVERRPIEDIIADRGASTARAQRQGRVEKERLIEELKPDSHLPAVAAIAKTRQAGPLNSISITRSDSETASDEGNSYSFEAALLQAGNRVPGYTTPSPGPAKRASTTTAYGGLVTPSTRRDTSTNRTGKRKFDALLDPLTEDLAPTTPTASRFVDRFSDSPTLSSNSHSLSAASHDLSSTLLSTLSSHNIRLPTAAEQDVVALCQRYGMKFKGTEKGREIARLALKAKDAKIAELRLRIATLAAELETERAVVRCLREGNWGRLETQDGLG